MEASKTALYLRDLLDEFGFTQEEPTIIYEDNTGCLALCTNSKFMPRTRHMQAYRMWLLEQTKEFKTIQVKSIKTEEQVADILTKALPKDKLEKFRAIMLGHV